MNYQDNLPHLLQYLQHLPSRMRANLKLEGKLVGFWGRKQAEYEAMAELIERYPGIRPSELARMLGVNRSTVMRRLPSLEEAGILLVEDERGGLSIFRRQRSR